MRKLIPLILIAVALCGASCSQSIDALILNTHRVVGYTRTANGVLGDLYDAKKIDAATLKSGATACKRIGQAIRTIYPVLIALNAGGGYSAQDKATLETGANSIASEIGGLADLPPSPQLAAVIQPLAAAADNLVQEIARTRPTSRARLTPEQAEQVLQIRANADELAEVKQ